MHFVVARCQDHLLDTGCEIHPVDIARTRHVKIAGQRRIIRPDRAGCDDKTHHAPDAKCQNQPCPCAFGDLECSSRRHTVSSFIVCRSDPENCDDGSRCWKFFDDLRSLCDGLINICGKLPRRILQGVHQKCRTHVPSGGKIGIAVIEVTYTVLFAGWECFSNRLVP